MFMIQSGRAMENKAHLKIVPFDILLCSQCTACGLELDEYNALAGNQVNFHMLYISKGTYFILRADSLVCECIWC